MIPSASQRLEPMSVAWIGPSIFSGSLTQSFFFFSCTSVSARCAVMQSLSFLEFTSYLVELAHNLDMGPQVEEVADGLTAT